jgi:N-acetylglutamate synthase/N-acetylornithine aminotransferase
VHSLSSTFDAPVALSEQASLVEVSPEMVAQSLDIDTEQVLPFSTGVIGQPLPMQCFRDNIAKLSTRLASDHLSQVAQAILTTDLVEKTVSKQFRVNGKTVAISGIAKGSGMIRPNMAKMATLVQCQYLMIAPPFHTLDKHYPALYCYRQHLYPHWHCHY